MKEGEAWLVIGPNGGGKADFVNALCGSLKILPNNSNNLSLYSNPFAESTELVSLERAAKLIQEERENDESEYVEGGVDIGRTGRLFICDIQKNIHKTDLSLAKKPLYNPEELDSHPVIKLCGIENILDRGLKYMSTGEIASVNLLQAVNYPQGFCVGNDKKAPRPPLLRKGTRKKRGFVYRSPAPQSVSGRIPYRPPRDAETLFSKGVCPISRKTSAVRSTSSPCPGSPPSRRMRANPPTA